MNMKDFVIWNKLGWIIKLSSPHFLPFLNSVTTLLMKDNGDYPLLFINSIVTE